MRNYLESDCPCGQSTNGACQSCFEQAMAVREKSETAGMNRAERRAALFGRAAVKAGKRRGNRS